MSPGAGSPQDAIGAAHLDALFVFAQRVPAFAERESDEAPTDLSIEAVMASDQTRLQVVQ